MTTEVLSNSDLAGWEGETDLLPYEDWDETTEHGDIYRKISRVGLVLVIPISFIVISDMGLLLLSYLLIVIGEVQTPKVRETYTLRVKVSPKLNALLFLEKARTGESMPEIVERVFKEWYSKR